MENKNNNVYDLISLLSKPQMLNTDVVKAISSLRDGIQNTYISKIYQTAEKENERIQKQPSKEVTLLKAFKNFASPAACQNIDNAINLINTLNIIHDVNQSALSCKPSINIKSNEENQAPQYQNMAMMTDMLVLMALMKKL